jgi:hypothetical protein
VTSSNVCQDTSVAPSQHRRPLQRGGELTQLSTTVTFNPNQNPDSTVKIVVVYNFSPITPFVPRSAVKMASTSQMLTYQ